MLVQMDLSAIRMQLRVCSKSSPLIHSESRDTDLSRSEFRHNTSGAEPVGEPGQDRTVIEPHTGLPMNVGRYGDGHGGTDGSPTIHGYRA